MILLPALPDVAKQTVNAEGNSYASLERVGMHGIETMVCIKKNMLLNARANVDVDLVEGHRGIHMSRLYQALDKMDETPLDNEMLKTIAIHMLDSQKGLSNRVYFSLKFGLPLKRKALLSNASGWRCYPIELKVEGQRGGLETFLNLELVYSSTCPCSLSLSRHAMARDWRAWADELDSTVIDVDEVAYWIEKSGSFPTPHSQRSKARISLKLSDGAEFDFKERINTFERGLRTPVQTLVKRIDEQLFAEINGANPLFCEDAVRRIAEQCESQKGVEGFRVEVNHEESLHAHDAVATAEKNFRD